MFERNVYRQIQNVLQSAVLSSLDVSSLLHCIVVATMSPKASAGKVNLVTWTPTEEELEAAREVLRGAEKASKRRSAMQAMVQFVKQNDEECQALILGARGPDRMEYCVKYMAYMARKKAGVTTVSSSHKSGVAKMKDFHMWSKYQMEQEVGPAKAAGWINSGKLQWFPDSITGCDDPEVREYKVPVQWLRVLESSENTFQLENTGDTTKEDLANLQKMQLTSEVPPTPEKKDLPAIELPTQGQLPAAEPPAPGQLPINVEVVTTEEKMKQSIAEFLADPNVVGDQLSEMEAQANKIYPEGMKNELLKTYCESLLRHIAQVTKLRKGVSEIIRGSRLTPNKYPILMGTIEKVMARHSKMLEFAIVNGLFVETKRKVSRRRQRAVE